MKVIKLLAIFVAMMVALSFTVELASIKSPLAWVALLLFPLIMWVAVTLGLKVIYKDSKN